MDSQLFFYLNIGLGLFFFIWFLSARKNRGHSPTQLKMRNFSRPASPSKDRPSPENNPHFGASDEAVNKAKNLNVLFLYNGHDWDAYAVLGVPAGASLPLVTERYQKLIKEAGSDKGQIEFFQAAYDAILKKV